MFTVGEHIFAIYLRTNAFKNTPQLYLPTSANKSGREAWLSPPNMS